MPKPKYRQPVDKKHKEHLEAFNFMDSFGGLARRKSQASQYSPMGSRLSSRNNSVSHPAAAPKTGRGLSYIGKVSENEHDDTDLFNGMLFQFSNPIFSRKSPLLNVYWEKVGSSRKHSLVGGLSRRHSREGMRPSNLHALATINSETSQSLKPSTNQVSPEHGRYTDAEIAEALKKLALKQQGKGKENAPPQ